MRQRDAIWERLARNGDFTLETKAVINNVEYDTITAPVLKGGLLSGDSLSVGNCISTTCKFTVMTNDDIPKAAKVVLWSRLSDGEENGLRSQWKEMGTFWIDKRSINDDLIDLECYDAMMMGNQTYVDNNSSSNWPKSMQAVVEHCAQQMGIQLDSRTSIHDYTIPYSTLTVAFEETTTYHLYAVASGNVSIEWGDGSTGQLRTDSSTNPQTHVYPQGVYVIKLTPANTQSNVSFTKSRTDAEIDDPYLIKVFVGSQASIEGPFGFDRSINLEKIDITNGIDRIYNQSFLHCTKLTRLVLPSSVSMLWSDITYGSGIKRVRIERTTPPSILFNRPFGNGVIVEVPYSAYNTYISNTTWQNKVGTENITYYMPDDEDAGKYGDYIINKPSDNDTLIELLRWIGGVNGGNWIITPENKLRLIPLVSSPPATYFVIDENYNRIQTDDGYNLKWRSGGSSSSNYPTDAQLIAKYVYAPYLMNVPVVIGEITTFPMYTISRVTMTFAETPEKTAIYTNGNDTGYHLIIEQNPCATQAICDNLFQKLNGLTYSPYSAKQTCFDPCVEYGDWITIGDSIVGVLFNMEQRFDLSYRVDIEAPGENEIESEYPFLTQAQKLRREVSALNMNSEYITSSLVEKANKDQIRTLFANDGTSILINEGTIAFQSDSSSSGIMCTQGRLLDGTNVDESAVYSFNNGMMKAYAETYDFIDNNSFADMISDSHLRGAVYFNKYSNAYKIMYIRTFNNTLLSIGADSGTSLHNNGNHTKSQIVIDPTSRKIELRSTSLSVWNPNSGSGTGVNTTISTGSLSLKFINGILVSVT